jgi:hypothetical protein
MQGVGALDRACFGLSGKEQAPQGCMLSHGCSALLGVGHKQPYLGRS